MKELDDLDWIRNFILGDEENDPMVTYLPTIAKVDKRINSIREKLKQMENTPPKSIIELGISKVNKELAEAMFNRESFRTEYEMSLIQIDDKITELRKDAKLLKDRFENAKDDGPKYE